MNAQHNHGQRILTAQMLAGHGITINPDNLCLQSCRGNLRSLAHDLAVYARRQCQWITVVDRAGNNWPIDSLWYGKALPDTYEGAVAVEVFVKKTGTLTVISN